MRKRVGAVCPIETFFYRRLQSFTLLTQHLYGGATLATPVRRRVRYDGLRIQFGFVELLGDTMTRSITAVIAAVVSVLVLSSGAALAQQCVERLKTVNDTLAKNPKVPPKHIVDAQRFRAEAEQALKDGKQGECVQAANRAMHVLSPDR